MKQEQKTGTTTMFDAVVQRQRDEYVLNMMKTLEHKKRKKMMTVKVGKSILTSTPDRIQEMLEYKGYDTDTINEIMKKHGYKQS